MIIPAESFPALNAALNAAAGLLLLAGYFAIRRRAVRAHVACMLTALVVSTVFLASYLYYHIVIKQGKSTEFSTQAPLAPGWVGPVYYTILISHIVLAVVTVPLALTTAYLGLTNRLSRHVRLARWTLPIWLYVSVTGVVVYWMLYRLYTAG
jgi:putative membrane protein